MENKPGNGFKFSQLDVQTTLTFSYGVLIFLGAIFDYSYYKMFGINILEYASIFDFLVEPLRKPQILLFFFFNALIVFGIIRFDTWWEKRFPVSYEKFSFGWSKKAWYSAYRFGTFAVIFFTYIYFSANWNALIQVKRWKSKQEKSRVCISENSCLEGKLIGVNNTYCFLKTDSNIFILPIGSQVAWIELQVKK